jgi:hypothetical protein
MENLGVAKPRKRKQRKLVWNEELYELSRVEKEAYDRWKMADSQMIREESDAYQEYRVIARIKQRKLRQNSRKLENGAIEDIEKLRHTKPKTYWDSLKRLGTNTETRKKLPKQMRTSAGQLVRGEEMLAVWKESFQKLGLDDKEGGGHFDGKVMLEVRDMVKKISERTPDERKNEEAREDEATKRMNRPIEEKEITEAIKTLRRGKAVGIDGITNELLKFGGQHVARAVWKLTNEIWQEDERFPTDWSRGLIIPIFKGGPPDYQHDPLKYRGITLLSVVGKLYTVVLNERITKNCEERGIFAEEQAGFRKKRSTVDQLFIMHEVIKGRKPKKTYSCFIDVQKAYDRVWRDGLWKKLDEYGIRGKMWRVIRNIYENVESCVVVDGKSTDWFSIEVGVRQGCILSPILFNLFINGLAEEIRKAGKGVIYGRVKLCILMFADDIVLLAENKEDLQILMDITYRYSQTWRFNFNYDKCAVVIFEDTTSGPIKYGECKVECTCGRHWKLGNRLIIETDSYKYLGAELDNRLTFKQFKARILDKARKSRARLWNMGMKQGALSVKASINLWEALVRSNLEYAAGVWGAGQWEEAELIQREMGRRILRCNGKTSNAAVRGELGWWKLSTRREYIKLRYWVSILLMDDTRLVKAVYDHSKQEYTSKNRNNWVKIVHQIVEKYGLNEIWDNEVAIRNEHNRHMTVEGIKKYWMRIIYKKIQDTEEIEWREELLRKPKLRTYRTIKDKLQLEPYLLSEINKKGRYLLTSLRTGTNRLRIGGENPKNQ